LAGALAALGGRLAPGFELVADEIDLADRLAGADLVITGEGHLDEQSFEGKVVGGVVAYASEAGAPVHAIVGDADDDARDRIPTTTLVERFGLARAEREPLWCIEQAALSVLTDRWPAA
jgi:glycerate kinase